MLTNLLTIYIINLIGDRRGMMIEKFAKRHKRCIVNIFSETSAWNMNKNPLIILFYDFWMLEDTVARLKYRKFIPLFFKSFEIIYCCTFNSFIFKFLQLAWLPKAADINILGHVLQHPIENILFIFFTIKI